MRNLAIIATAVLLLGVAAAAAFYFANRTEESPPQVERPDYRSVKSVEEMVILDYHWFRQLHECGQEYPLQPRVKAILDDIANIHSPEEFSARVDAELIKILREQAEAFCDARPEIWKQLSTPPKALSQELTNETDAVLPACLDPEEQTDAIWAGEFIQAIEAASGGKPRTYKPLERRDLSNTEMVTQFVSASQPLVDALFASLKKPNLYATTRTTYHPKWWVELPIPNHWDVIMYRRIQVQLCQGELESAAELTFACLELFERAKLSTDMIGARVQAECFCAHFVKQCVSPCAEYGALDADQLSEIYNRGRAVSFELGICFANLCLYGITHYRADYWDQPDRPELRVTVLESVGWAYGCQGVDACVSRLVEKRPKQIEVFEAELDGMLGGRFNLEKSREFWPLRDLLLEVLEAVALIPLRVDFRNMYMAQLSWQEVRVRAEEVRTKRPLQKWENWLRAFQVDGYKVQRQQNCLVLDADPRFFSNLKVGTHYWPVETVRFLNYPWDQ